TAKVPRCARHDSGAFPAISCILGFCHDIGDVGQNSRAFKGIGMRILVVGGGGREHALCWAIAASPLCTKLYCAPGNAGIGQRAECSEVAAEDIAGQVALAVAERIDFVIVGPEVPLAAGLADRLAEAGIKVFGPSARAAQLESSKGFTKELCQRHDIPTGAFERFTDA